MSAEQSIIQQQLAILKEKSGAGELDLNQIKALETLVKLKVVLTAASASEELLDEMNEFDTDSLKRLLKVVGD